MLCLRARDECRQMSLFQRTTAFLREREQPIKKRGTLLLMNLKADLAERRTAAVLQNFHDAAAERPSPRDS